MRRTVLLLISILFFVGVSTPLKAQSLEGYKEIAWGTNYKDFLQQKKFNKKLDVESSIDFEIGCFSSSDLPQPGFWQHKDQQLSDHLDDLKNNIQLLNGLIKGFHILKYNEKDGSPIGPLVMSDRYKSVYLKKDDSVFLFYKDKFFSAVTTIEEETFDDVGKELEKKYGQGIPFDYPAFGEIEHEKYNGEPLDNRHVYKCTGRKYSKGKHTVIFLVKTEHKLLNEDLEGLKNYGLVYFDIDCLKPIQDDFKQSVAQEKKGLEDQEKDKDVPDPTNTPTDENKDLNLKKVD